MLKLFKMMFGQTPEEHLDEIIENKKKSISQIYDEEKTRINHSFVTLLEEAEAIGKKPKTIYRWLSYENIMKLLANQSIIVKIGDQKLRLKKRK